MEDDFGVAYQQTSDEKDLEYAFFGIFDGHGGKEAALFAKVNLIFDIFQIFKENSGHFKMLFRISGTFDGLYCDAERVLGRGG